MQDNRIILFPIVSIKLQLKFIKICLDSKLNSIQLNSHIQVTFFFFLLNLTHCFVEKKTAYEKNEKNKLS